MDELNNPGGQFDMKNQYNTHQNQMQNPFQNFTNPEKQDEEMKDAYSNSDNQNELNKQPKEKESQKKEKVENENHYLTNWGKTVKNVKQDSLNYTSNLKNNEFSINNEIISSFNFMV